MAKIEMTKEAIEAINDILNKDLLDNYIDLINVVMDDYLFQIPDGQEEAKQILDNVASLRNLGKILEKLKNSL
jgi:hypothetical protein